jgi:hypothetical protein
MKKPLEEDGRKQKWGQGIITANSLEKIVL